MKDTSIFQGIVEFLAPDGNEYRAEDNYISWKIYKKIDDAFIFQTFVDVGSSKNPTPSKIWKAIQS